MLTQKQIKDLEIFAAEIRLGTVVEMTSFGMGHIGGAMSIAETLAVLYGEIMNVDPKNPRWEQRDYFALSKGHAGPALYATLAVKGFFPTDKLPTMNANGTMLPSHCSRVHTPGVDLTTGSLGQGISTAAGAALASRMLGADNYAYCIVGDGECDEGQIWEGILFAAHQKLDNFVLIIDNNKVQLDGTTDDVCALGDLSAKMKDFNFYTQEVDGHDISALYEAFMNCKKQKGQANCVIIDTIKGKGCKMAEDAVKNGGMNHAMPFIDAEQNAAEIKRQQDALAALKAERSAM